MTQPEAVAPDQWGEWIEWSGGENPVPGETVEIRFGDGGVQRPCRSERVIWRWVHKGEGGDVHAYRVRLPLPAASVSQGTSKASEPQNNPHPGRGEGEPGIIVVREPASGMEREHCCFCAKKTEFWSAKADVAVCPTCAGTRYQYEVPTKAEWIRSPQSKGIATPTTYGKGEREAVEIVEEWLAMVGTFTPTSLSRVRHVPICQPEVEAIQAVLQALQLGRE